MSRVRAINNGTQMIDNHIKSQAKKHTLVKAAAVGVAAGSVLYLAQKGKLNPKEGGNQFLETGKTILRKPASAVLNGVKKVNTSVTEKLNQAAKTKYWAGWIIEHGKAAKRFVNKQITKMSGVLDSLSNITERLFNRAKFAPEKAKAVDVAAETFNNFIK